jgi:drug/metabolite transporter (DMT)-like permease
VTVFYRTPAIAITGTMKKISSTVSFNLMMLVCIVVWAFAFPFIKFSLNNGLSYTSLTILRFSIVSLVSLFLIAVQPKRFTPIQKKDIFPIFLIGFFGVMMYHFGLNYGEQLVSPGVASLIVATSPVFSILLAVLFLKETFGRIKIIGVAIAFGGVILISLWGTSTASIEIKYLTAALAVLMAACMGSIYTVAGKKFLTRYTPLSLTLYAMLLGSLALIPISFVTPVFFTEITRLPLLTWFAVLFLGVFSTVIGYGLWYVGLEKKTASGISVYLYGIPVLSTLISYVMFRDNITIMYILGGVLVIGGLVLVNKKSKIGDAAMFFLRGKRRFL